MGNWHSIDTQNDIDVLVGTYGDFHDSCIVSANFQSGNSVMMKWQWVSVMQKIIRYQ